MRRTTRRRFGAGLAIGGAWIALPVLAQQKTKVVASFTILADLVANVGGDRIELATLVGADRDAHTYEPTPSDSRTLAAARVLVTNGLGFEPWADRLARAAPFRGRLIVATAEVSRERYLTAEHHHGQHAATDPHMFQDVALARRYVAAIAKGLAEADPAGAPDYRGRAEAYDKRLAELDAWVRQQIGTVPAAKRKVITSHDAFHYFGRAYGVAFHAPQGLSTAQQASARDVAALIRQIRQEGIRALFVENVSNPKLIEQIAREAGGVVGPELFVDALSPPGGPADTYEKMFRHNVAALVAGMAKN
ncbi:MAG: metal ABC transporter solute-binding protein, Zn/Mn family [Reyranellaceae bacterium]